MKTLAEDIARRVTEVWRTPDTPRRGHTYRCQCGRPVFFRNSLCLACGVALGYEPDRAEVRSILPMGNSATWRVAGDDDSSVYRRCENFDSPAGVQLARARGAPFEALHCLPPEPHHPESR